MIPRLFKSDATTFDTLGLGTLTRTVSCNVIEELNGAYELNMTMLVDDPLFEFVQIGNIVAAVPNMAGSPQAFVIESVSKVINGEVTVYATHISQYRTKLIPVKAFATSTIAAVINALNTSSTYAEACPFTFSTDMTSSAGLTMVFPKSLRDLMGGTEGSILDSFGGEWQFDNFNISLLKRRGRETDARVMYGRNMTGFTQDELFAWNNSATGVLPYWCSDKGIANVVGDVQYSQYADLFPYKKTVTVDFTDKFEEMPTQADLESYALQWINSKGLPAVTLECSFDQFDMTDAQVNTLQLGDSVQVINSMYNVNYSSRIVAMDFDVLAETYNSITVGDLKATLSGVIGEQIGSSTISAGGGGDYVEKSGDTMTGQLKTSFNQSVAMGSYKAVSTTIPDLVDELRMSSGVMGSANIKTTYTNGGLTIPGGNSTWYNFIYSPHRSGGVNGSASGDNCNYGTLLLFSMTSNAGSFRIRVDGGTITAVEKWLPYVTTNEDGKILRVVDGVWSISNESGPSGSAITDAVKQALLALFRAVAYVGTNGQSLYNTLFSALYTSTVVSITAVFNQGQAVIYDTDTLDDLKPYLTVTANYDDGTSGEVSGYELSGTLTPGTSTITVTYQNKTTTFTVNVTQGVVPLWTFTNGYAIAKGSQKIYRTSTAARACGAAPIANNNYVFTVTDSTKYNIAAYDITSLTHMTTQVPATAVDGYYYQGGSKTISWQTTDSVTSEYVWLSLRKLDGTAFTDAELANGAQAVFTYTSS